MGYVIIILYINVQIQKGTLDISCLFVFFFFSEHEHNYIVQ
jgi:hypothetical protein